MDRRSFHIKQHDTAPPFEVTLQVDGEAVDLRAAAAVRFVMADARSRKVVVDAPAQIDQTGDGSDGTMGHVSYHWQEGDTATAGTFLCEWEVAYIDGTRRTFPNPGYDVVQIHGDLG